MDSKTEKKIDALKTSNLVAGGKFNLEDIPIRKFYDQAQYIEKTLLPAIEKKSGRQSADYQFFCDVYRSLLYAALIVDRGNNLLIRLVQARQLNEIWQRRAEAAELLLLKYTTVEDILMTDGMDKIAADVKRRIENLVTNKQ